MNIPAMLAGYMSVLQIHILGNIKKIKKILKSLGERVKEQKGGITNHNKWEEVIKLTRNNWSII